MAALGLAGLPVQSAYAQQHQHQQPHPQQQQLGIGLAPHPQQLAAPAPQPQALDPLSVTIKLATMAGERFKDLWRLFAPECMLVWEGTEVFGRDKCKVAFDSLPSSKHTVETFDVQPVSGGADLRGGMNGLIVTVTGTVTWGLSNSETATAPTGFYHSFVLERSASAGSASGKQVHHVISASMRTRHIEDAAEEQQGQRRRKTFGDRSRR